MGYLYSFLFCLIFAIGYIIYQYKTYKHVEPGDYFGVLIVTALSAIGVWFITSLMTWAVYSDIIKGGNLDKFEQVESTSYFMITGEDGGAVYYNKADGCYNFAYYDKGVPVGIDVEHPGQLEIRSNVFGESPRVTIYQWKVKNKLFYAFCHSEFESYEIFIPNDSLIKVIGIDQVKKSDWF